MKTTDPQYIVYTKPNCVFCRKAKELLRLNNIGFVERSLKFPTATAEFKKQWPNITSVPVILEFGSKKWVGGFVELVNRIENETQTKENEK